MNYNEQLSIARKWQNCVDYGSPITAWTMQMFDILNKHSGDKAKAQKELFESRK